MKNPDLDQMDDLQQFVYALTLIPKEKRHPIWLVADGVCITGIIATQYEKDQRDIIYLRDVRQGSPVSLSAADEDEMQGEAAPQDDFDPEYIHFIDPVIYVAGIALGSHTASARFARGSAWGIGNPAKLPA